jgi:hypothetical protein
MSNEINMYLLQILQKYQVRNIVSNVETELKNYLFSWCQKCDPEIFLSGSRSKQTAISLVSDYDYFVSLSSDCNVNQMGIEAISDALHEHLKKKYYYNIRRQNVSTRIEISGLNIDITAGIKISGYQNYHWLYRSKDGSKKQTNAKMHIDDVSKSGRTNEIKLLKIWREINKLEFPSIYLEYLMIKNILLNKSTNTNNLADNVSYTFSELAKDSGNPLYSKIDDPANTTNILSELLNQTEKTKIINAAKVAIRSNWNQVFY